MVSTSIDSYVFRLHYRWTSAFCFIACVLLAASSVFTDPIHCVTSDKAMAETLNTYCWMTATYTINRRAFNPDTVAHPGDRWNHEEERKYHPYYRWVTTVLLIQGFLFYLPHLLWKSYENRKVDLLLQGLNVNTIGDDADAKKDNIINYLKVSAGRNWKYSIVYLICEAVNFINVIAQMFLLDKFFGGMFMDLGTKVIDYAVNVVDEDRLDPLLATFPRMTKCLYHGFDSSGDIMRHDALCMLPHNIFNEKIFLFMWFWFVILATITAAYLVWLVVLLASPEVRVQSMLRYGGEFSAFPELENSIRQLHFGDFFLLDILKQNVDALVFRDIATGLIDKLENDGL